MESQSYPRRCFFLSFVFIVFSAATLQAESVLIFAADVEAASSLLVTRGPYKDSVVLPQLSTATLAGFEAGYLPGWFARGEVGLGTVLPSPYDSYGERYRGYSGAFVGLGIGYQGLGAGPLRAGGILGYGSIVARGSLSDLDRLIPAYLAEAFAILNLGTSPFSMRLAAPLRLLNLGEEGFSVEIGVKLGARIGL